MKQMHPIPPRFLLPVVKCDFRPKLSPNNKCETPLGRKPLCTLSGRALLLSWHRRNSSLHMHSFWQIARGEACQVTGTHLPHSYTACSSKLDKWMTSDRAGERVGGKWGGRRKGYKEKGDTITLRTDSDFQLLVSSVLWLESRQMTWWVWFIRPSLILESWNKKLLQSAGFCHH